MYFANKAKIKYDFGPSNTSNVHTVVDLFNRIVLNEPKSNYTYTQITTTPDTLAGELYGDNTLFYTNLLLNNTLSKNDLPIDQVRFETEINSYHSGFVFHILEEPEQTLNRGDIIVLTSDLALDSCTNPDDLNCHISYAVIEEWDPILKKIWCKYYAFGAGGSKSEDELFRNQNKFKIFKQDTMGRFDLDGVQIKNESAFSRAVTDKKYTFQDGIFTMKRVSKFSSSLDSFYTEDGNYVINPHALNVSSSAGSNIEQFAPTYSSSLLNTECSILDAYILSAASEKDYSNTNYRVNSDILFRSRINQFMIDNDDKKEIKVLKKKAVGNVAQSVSRYK